MFFHLTVFTCFKFSRRSNTPSTVCLADLPNSVLFQIFKNVSFWQRVNILEKVNRQWSELSKSVGHSEDEFRAISEDLFSSNPKWKAIGRKFFVLPERYFPYYEVSIHIFEWLFARCGAAVQELNPRLLVVTGGETLFTDHILDMLPNLRHIVLPKHMQTNSAWTAIVGHVPKLKSLVIPSLNDNQQKHHIEVGLNMVFNKCHQLEYLYVKCKHELHFIKQESKCAPLKLLELPGAAQCKILAHIAQDVRLSSLAHNFCSSVIEDKFNLTNAFNVYSRLRCLNLKIDTNCDQHLSEAAKRWHNLEALSLGGKFRTNENEKLPEISKVVESVVKKCPNLVHICLQNCSLWDYVLPVLAEIPKLVSLDINYLELNTEEVMSTTEKVGAYNIACRKLFAHMIKIARLQHFSTYADLGVELSCEALVNCKDLKVYAGQGKQQKTFNKNDNSQALRIMIKAGFSDDPEDVGAYERLKGYFCKIEPRSETLQRIRVADLHGSNVPTYDSTLSNSIW
uniref:F-box domain-containing protein n=1 Tax=Ditylenchus dipsaci TaxID=166011 RepID=A0A915E947_9BILA